MRWWRGFVIGLALGLLTGAVFLGGYVLGARQHAEAADDGAFATLWTVRDLLSSRFVGEAPAVQAQVYNAARGLAESYADPYTRFIEPAPREMERDELRGHFGGIGAYMSRNQAGDLVVTVMRDQPAARAGIQDGDILVAVDDREVTPDMAVEEVVILVRGEVGTEVTLKLVRPGQIEPYTVVIIRERIETPSVEWRVLDQAKQIGYVRLMLFSERTANELRGGLDELAATGVNKLILDLRGNGGGLVDAAVEVTSLFLREGQVLREIKRGGQERFYPVKSTSSPAHDWQLALLVDAGTASASEIVAGALRDQERAILIGEKTYGKGSVQEVHELPDGSSVHVTVARWLTPNRHQIDGSGLLPTIEIGLTQEDRDHGRDPQLSRAQTWLADKR